MGIGPPFTVDAPPRVPGKYGLFGVATELSSPDGGDEKWAASIEVQGEPCTLPAPRAVLCAEEDAPPLPAVPGIVQWEPFIVSGVDPCHTTWDPERDRAGLARRNLENTESHQAEQEFMYLAATGSQPADLQNPGLISARTPDEFVTGDLREVLSVIDGRLYTALGGRQGFIHVEPVAAAFGVEHDVFHWDGGKLISALGNKVVVGSGYSAGVILYSGNAASALDPTPTDVTDGLLATPPTSIAFGTPPVFYLRGEILVTGDDMVAVNRRTNDREVRAQRTVILYMEDCYRIRGDITLDVSAEFGLTQAS